MAENQGKKIIGSIVTVLAVILLVLVSALIVSSIAGTTSLTDTSLSGSVVNESGAYVNITGYTLDGASLGLTSFSPTITAVWANVSGTQYLVPASNYTLTGNVLYNNSIVPNATEYNDANVSYTYTYTDGTNAVGINITSVKNSFGYFVTALLGFLAVIGVMLAIVWLVVYIKPLFGKKEGIQNLASGS